MITNFSALVDRGAIEPLIALARGNGPSKLRFISVELLCIISSESRHRKDLCHSGAPEVFGLILKQDVPKLYKVVQREVGKDLNDMPVDALEESYCALLALANLLESTSTSRNRRARSSLSEVSGSGANMEALRQTAASGGLEALLILVTLPLSVSFPDYSADINTFDANDLGLESSRSLASLCPLLLSESASTAGLTPWAGDIFLALTKLLRRQAEDEKKAGALREQQLDALRGLAYLAQYEPL